VTLIKLEGITKAFGERKVLDNISLEIAEGDYVSISGQSGAGKSTLMNIIGTLDNSYSGDYLYRGAKLKENERDSFRNHKLGFIFQQFNLLPSISALENVTLPYVFSKDIDKEFNNKIEVLFNKLSLSEQMHQIVATLSGGEKQRVALLRSIVMNPEIILADEPTGNLDKDNSLLIRNFLKDMNNEGKTIIVVTHDREFAQDAKRKLYLEGGQFNELA